MAPQVNGDTTPSSAFLSVRPLYLPITPHTQLTISLPTAPLLLPRNQRQHQHLQIQPLRRQVPRHRQHNLLQAQRAHPPLPIQALPIRLPLRRES